MKGLRFSHNAALVVGLVLPVLETWRRWGAWADWPAFLDDYIAAALLLYAWYAGQRSLIESRPYLMAAWGYMLGIAYMSFFGQLRQLGGLDVSGYSSETAIGVKGFGLALSAICLTAAWRAHK